MEDNKKLAEKEKDLGNAALGKNDMEGAITHYSKAIELDPSNHVMYSNRSAAYTKMKKYDEAVKDADKAIQISPGWARGYSRKGTALCYNGDFEKAKETFMQGLEKCPNEPTLQEGLRDVMKAEQESQSTMLGNVFGRMFQGDFWSKLKNDPETRPLLDDPSFVSLLNSISKNPALVANYLQDRRMSAVMGVLLNLKGNPGDDDDDVELPPRKAEPPKKEEKKILYPSFCYE